MTKYNNNEVEKDIDALQLEFDNLTIKIQFLEKLMIMIQQNKTVQSAYYVFTEQHPHETPDSIKELLRLHDKLLERANEIRDYNTIQKQRVLTEFKTTIDNATQQITEQANNYYKLIGQQNLLDESIKELDKKLSEIHNSPDVKIKPEATCILDLYSQQKNDIEILNQKIQFLQDYFSLVDKLLYRKDQLSAEQLIYFMPAWNRIQQKKTQKNDIEILKDIIGDIDNDSKVALSLADDLKLFTDAELSELWKNTAVKIQELIETRQSLMSFINMLDSATQNVYNDEITYSLLIEQYNKLKEEYSNITDQLQEFTLIKSNSTEILQTNQILPIEIFHSYSELVASYEEFKQQQSELNNRIEAEKENIKATEEYFSQYSESQEIDMLLDNAPTFVHDEDDEEIKNIEEQLTQIRDLIKQIHQVAPVNTALIKLTKLFKEESDGFLANKLQEIILSPSPFYKELDQQIIQLDTPINLLNKVIESDECNTDMFKVTDLSVTQDLKDIPTLAHLITMAEQANACSKQIRDLKCFFEENPEIKNTEAEIKAIIQNKASDEQQAQELIATLDNFTIEALQEKQNKLLRKKEKIYSKKVAVDSYITQLDVATINIAKVPDYKSLIRDYQTLYATYKEKYPQQKECFIDNLTMDLSWSALSKCTLPYKKELKFIETQLDNRAKTINEVYQNPLVQLASENVKKYVVMTKGDNLVINNDLVLKLEKKRDELNIEIANLFEQAKLLQCINEESTAALNDALQTIETYYTFERIEFVNVEINELKKAQQNILALMLRFTEDEALANNTIEILYEEFKNKLKFASSSSENVVDILRQKLLKRHEDLIYVREKIINYFLDQLDIATAKQFQSQKTYKQVIAQFNDMSNRRKDLCNLLQAEMHANISLMTSKQSLWGAINAERQRIGSTSSDESSYETETMSSSSSDGNSSPRMT